MSETFRVLLTNDDGIDAPGLNALRRAFLSNTNMSVFVVAPDREMSTCSHSMTLGKKVAVTTPAPNTFVVSGTPADCVFLAYNVLLPQTPHLVVSGINRGANLGSDVIFSGTVAGARQGFLMGMHGISTSLTAGENFDDAAAWTVRVAEQILRRGLETPMLLNLNFPERKPEGMQFCTLGKRRYPQTVRVHPEGADGVTAYELGGPDVVDEQVPGTDGGLIAENIASATLLACDQSDIRRMKDPFFAIEGIAPLQQDA